MRIGHKVIYRIYWLREEGRGILERREYDYQMTIRKVKFEQQEVCGFIVDVEVPVSEIKKTFETEEEALYWLKNGWKMDKELEYVKNRIAILKKEYPKKTHYHDISFNLWDKMITAYENTIKDNITENANKRCQMCQRPMNNENKCTNAYCMNCPDYIL